MLALEDRVLELREARKGRVPAFLQDVTKARIKQVLTQLALGDNADLVDVVFALLDNETENWFAKPPTGAKFCDGASTAHLACHVGILQRGKSKLDREGRDYWIKPLRELGGIEAITLVDGRFVSGHVTAKSPNSSYRLNSDLKDILKAPEDEWRRLLAGWAKEDSARARRTFQAEMEETFRQQVDSGHADLIKASIEHYAPHFLPGYELLYIDDSDGDRISEAEKVKLSAAGLVLTIDDPMPDALYWNPDTDHLWIIEAVTSDGEVDIHKVAQVTRMAKRCRKSGVGFTTTYRTWKEAASRQSAHQNIAVDTYIWIQNDPSKQLLVCSFD